MRMPNGVSTDELPKLSEPAEPLSKVESLAIATFGHLQGCQLCLAHRAGLSYGRIARMAEGQTRRPVCAGDVASVVAEHRADIQRDADKLHRLSWLPGRVEGLPTLRVIGGQ